MVKEIFMEDKLKIIDLAIKNKAKDNSIDIIRLASELEKSLC